MIPGSSFEEFRCKTIRAMPEQTEDIETWNKKCGTVFNASEKRRHGRAARTRKMRGEEDGNARGIAWSHTRRREKGSGILRDPV